MRVFSLLTVCALVALVAAPVQADLIKKEMDLEKKAVKLAREMDRGGYKLITTEELKTMSDSTPDLLVVDTMPYDDSFLKHHVPKAKQFLFPIEDMPEWDASKTDGKSPEDFAALLGPDKARPIVIYCGFVKCTRSHNGALWAVKLGYTNVKRHPGGIKAWEEAEYPIEKGE